MKTPPSRQELSGFREAFRQMFGRPPGNSRQIDCIRVAWMESPLGPLLAGATAEGICFLEFTDRRALESQVLSLRKGFGRPIVPGGNEHIDQLKAELARYFTGELREFHVPLIYAGTPFQRSVWDRLRQIGYGETTTYDALARDLGVPKATRAVGHANGQNPISIVIPCHRVIGKNGQLRGYGGGLWRKRALLELEWG